MKTITGRYVVEASADTHVHLREIGPVMEAVINDCYDGGADVIGPQPNTDPPLVIASNVVRYIESARAFVPAGKIMRFIPFIMLTERTTKVELIECACLGIRDGKIYPYLRTTKSDHGVKNYYPMIQVVQWCGELGIKVHAHFEHPNMLHGNREAEYLCLPIAELFLQNSDAIIIWEHGSDGRCAPFWKQFAKKHPGRFYVTLTAHHLAWEEDSAYGDVRKTCKPSIKTGLDCAALIHLVTENHYWVMAGSDVAPHDVKGKHVEKGKCACGDYTAPFLHALYAHALSHLFVTPDGLITYVNFTSRNARKLHNLPPASRMITLTQEAFKIPSFYTVGPWKVEPPGADEEIGFAVAA
ncbi:MAG: hypothetical protein HYV68_02145 [Candidatus Taylorbacteria bacterium]|nr:hypothetical protein [Candidatus Taylorbacteria bacterium]